MKRVETRKNRINEQGREVTSRNQRNLKKVETRKKQKKTSKN